MVTATGINTPVDHVPSLDRRADNIAHDDTRTTTLLVYYETSTMHNLVKIASFSAENSNQR